LCTGPLIIDIDYKTDCNKRYYTEKHIKYIIEQLFTNFKKYLNIENCNLVAYITEKPTPTYESKKNVYKDGFHIFIDIPLCVEKRKFFFDLIKNDDIFDDIPYNKNYTTKIFDDSVLISNGMIMYGSHKYDKDTKETLPSYKLTHVYNHNMDKITISEYDNKDLVSLFSLRTYTDAEDITFRNNYKDLEQHLLENKQKVLKLKKQKVELNVQDEQDDSDDLDEQDNIQNIKKVNKVNNIPDSLLEIRELIEILSDNRAADFHSWIRVCWCLNNISQDTNQDLKQEFINFSKKAKNYNYEGCIKEWENACDKKGLLTVASLKYWANQDNPEKYKYIRFHRLEKLIEELDQATHDDIANFIKEMYKDKFVCVNYKKSIWYEFQKHRWVVVEDGHTLLEKIASDVTKELMNIYQYFGNETNNKKNIYRDDNIKKLQKLCCLISKLKDHNFGKTLVDACKKKFFDSKFEESLNENKMLLGFNNGIYDLETQCFRDGVPDDRITFSVGYNYINFDENNKFMDKIMDFFHKIQPLEEMREYLLRLSASFLDGNNKDQQFLIATGTGANGKSKYISLMFKTLGDYSSTMPNTILTAKDNNCNGPSPFLADKKGKRMIELHESEKEDSIQVGKMKELTGGDLIQTRKLFGDPTSFVLQAKLLLICNKLPHIPSDDGGTWRRIRVIEFKSKFVDKKDVDISNHKYEIDKSLDEKIKTWAPCFMTLLLKIYYPKYNTEGLNEPAQVLQRSEEYKKESDILFDFCSENLIKSPDETEKITQLFEHLKVHIKNNYSGKYTFTKKDLKEYLIEKLKYRVEKDILYGYTIDSSINNY